MPAGLAPRVAEVAARLERAPATARVVLEFGDVRVAVSVRADVVRVALLGAGDGARPLPPGWLPGLSAALDARGLNLASGQSDHQGSGQQAPQDGGPPPAPTPARPRPARAADRGLRL